MTLRKLHRQIAPILFLPLMVSTLTGISFRLGRSWFQIPHEVSNILLVIHQGEYLGQPLVPIYVLLVGTGALGLLTTGVTMLIQGQRRPSRPKRGFTGRQIHRLVAPILCLPLFATATTGIAYRLGQNWFGLGQPQISLLLRIHQGSYLGPILRHFYVLFLGLGLLVLLTTGINMTGILRKRRPINH